MSQKRLLERYNGKKLMWLHDSIHFIVLIAVLFTVFRFVIGISVIGGDSMKPTLLNGDIVVYLRTVKQYEPGDIISMWVPSGEYYVKRVIATGGDTIDIYDGNVYVNGNLLDEPWAYGDTEEETGAIIFPYLVRDGNVFVLGDNRRVSMDSRAFGEVNLRQIRGRIILQFGDGKLRRIFKGGADAEV